MRSFLYVFIGLMIVSFNAYGDGPAKTLTKQEMNGDYDLRTVCVGGYKFVVVQDWITGDSISISIVQFYENQNGNAVPARC